MTTTADLREMRAVVAGVSELTGSSIGQVDSDVVMVAGLGRVGVTSIAAALDAAGIKASEWSGPDQVDRLDGDVHGSGGGAAIALLIVDPSSGVGEPEVELLRALTATAPIVALVCNKIDAFWDWPTLLKANRQLLDPHGRLPIFAVSAAAALAGHHAGSGFEALTGWLREQIHPADRRERLATVAADRTLEAFVEDLATVDHGSDPAAALLDERAALAGTRDRGRMDRLAALRAGAGQIRGDVTGALNSTTRTIDAGATAAVARLDRSGETSFVQWLEAELTQVRTGILHRLDDELDGLQARTMLGLEDAAPAAPARSCQTVTVPALPGPRRGAEEALLVVFGASAGLGLGRLVVTPMASVDTLQWISMPLTLVLGVVIAVGMVRIRRLSTRRAAMATWAHDAVGDVRSQIEREMVRQVSSAESVIGGRLTRHYERRSQGAVARIAEVDREIRRVRQAAVGRRDGDLAKLAAAAEVRDRLDPLLEAIGH